MRELIFSTSIKDCEVQTFRGSGPGGQHRNKTDTGVRVKHHPSGAVGEDCSTRSQLDNKRSAFRKMGESSVFQVWVKTKALGLRPIEDVVDEMMSDEFLKIEYF